MPNFARATGAHADTLDFSKTVEIARGEKIDFSKANPDVNRIRVELHWEGTHDADAAIMLLGADKKALSGLKDPKDKNSTVGMVWYNNLQNPGVLHSGDAREADDDPSSPEETITIDLKALATGVASVVIVASTYPEDDAGQGKAVPFGLIENCRVDVINDATSEVLYTYHVGEDHSTVTSVELLNLYKFQESWKLVSMDTGVGKSAQALSDIASKYGLS
jgi:stress response protein SCP2